MEKRSDVHFEALLDNNSYDETQLVSIKVPVTHLAYYNTSKNFERADGQIEINGVAYKYVKRRVFNDTLEMLCIPNKPKMQLNEAKNEFFKLVTDLQPDNQAKKTSSHKNFSKFFSTDNYTSNDIIALNKFSAFISKPLFSYTEPLSYCCSCTDEQPPDFIV
ncbi:MAG: hypothetical protein JST47_10255 [Bacteroidetes bacterium]|nr:hypothetical protein [Bacteroidota bacterium]